MSTLKKVAFIIVSYRMAASTITCISSILASDYSSFEIFVIDNGRDIELEKGLARFHDSRINLAQVGRNLGFPAACNIGIRLVLNTDAELIFLLNNDSVIVKSGLRRMVVMMNADPSVGILGPAIMSSSNQSRMESMGGWFDIRLGEAGLFGRGRNSKDGFNGKFEVDFVPGAAMLLRRETIQRVGLLNEALFMYGDDIEYCFRANTKGFKIASGGVPIVKHNMSTTSQRYPGLKQYYLFRNRLIIPYLLGLSLQFVEACCFQLAAAPLRMLNYLRLGDAQAARGHVLGLIDGLRLKYGPSSRTEYRPP